MKQNVIITFCHEIIQLFKYTFFREKRNDSSNKVLENLLIYERESFGNFTGEIKEEKHRISKLHPEQTQYMSLCCLDCLHPRIFACRGQNEEAT